MSRILLVLSLVLILASAWFIYSQGLLAQLFNPTVVALRANQDIPTAYRVQPAMVRGVEVSVADLPPGTLAFPRGANEAQIAEVLAPGRALDAIAKDAFLSASNFGKGAEVWQIRALASFRAGDPMEVADLEVITSDTPTARGMTFKSRAEADQYLQSQSGLRALVALEPGAVLGMDDISAGDGGMVYALETTGPLASGATLTAADVRAISLPSTDIPRGAIAFPSRAGAEIFATAAQSVALAVDVPAGAVLDATMLRPGVGRVLRNAGDPDAPPPETLADLLDLQTQDPFSVKLINLAARGTDLDVEPAIALVGAAPMEGDTMDLWVETARTNGPYGAITLRRFVRGIEVRKVVDPELVLAAMQRQEAVASAEVSGATPPSDVQEPEDVRGIFYWANISRAGGLAIEEAKADGRLIFAMSTRTPVSDFLGNGVLCREDYCTISIAASNDLADVRAAIEQFRNQGEETEVVELPPAPFSILDGVSPEIEASMHAAGYTTFESVAQWEDAQLQVLTLELNVSRTLVLYIREQARTIVNMPTAARQQLSIAATPTE